MGERAYIIRKENGKFRALYSHWGAGYIQKWLENDFKERIKDQINTDALKGAKERFRQFINEVVNLEIEHKKEEWVEIKDIYGFVDITDIIIEAYVIDNGKNFYVVLPFISNRIHGAIVSKIFDYAYENFKTKWLFEEFKAIARFYDVAFKDIEDTRIKEEIKGYFHKQYFEPRLERWLKIDRIDRVTMDIMTGKAVLIL